MMELFWIGVLYGLFEGVFLYGAASYFWDKYGKRPPFDVILAVAIAVFFYPVTLLIAGGLFIVRKYVLKISE